jgi:hypothetical protein
MMGTLMDEIDREKSRTYKKKWMRQNPEKAKAYQEKNKMNMRIRRASIPTRDKPNQCEICGEASQLCFDHCHKSKTFRGWICHPCNRALGMFSDDPKRFRRAAEYIERHQESQL